MDAYLTGVDIVGQSLCSEAYLAREISVCYARVDLVVNYALYELSEENKRECEMLRKETLLKNNK